MKVTKNKQLQNYLASWKGFKLKRYLCVTLCFTIETDIDLIVKIF